MSREYPCIGGPIDGKSRVLANGCPDLYVAELPERAPRYSRDDSDPTFVPVKRHRYTLREVPGVGLALVHQS